MTTFEQATITVALRELFEGCHFSICSVDRLGELIGTNPKKHPGYRWLQALHCVDYAKMPREVRDELPQRVMEVLRPGSLNFEGMAAALTREGRDHPPIEDNYLEASPKVSRLPWRKA